MATEIYIATESGSADVKGETFVFVKGQTRVRAGHPLLKAVPDYFTPVETTVTYEHGQAKTAADAKRHEENLAAEAALAAAAGDVEAATAGPGEKRAGRRARGSRKKAAAKKPPATKTAPKTPAEPETPAAPEPVAAGGLTTSSAKGA